MARFIVVHTLKNNQRPYREEYDDRGNACIRILQLMYARHADTIRFFTPNPNGHTLPPILEMQYNTGGL